jgi:hypothetical protein
MHHHHQHAATPSEPDAGRPHPQHVVLDIGGDAGALIVHTDPELLAVEVEISPAGHDEHRSHKQVLQRTAGDRPACTLVYDNLAEGRYTLWIDNTPRARDVQVIRAQITELDWRRS